MHEGNCCHVQSKGLGTRLIINNINCLKSMHNCSISNKQVPFSILTSAADVPISITILDGIKEVHIVAPMLSQCLTDTVSATVAQY